MKKILFSLCIALFGLCASAQQKGDMAVGLNLGVAPCLESGASLTNFGIGAKFQYNVTNPIRLEADLDYWFKDKGVDIFDISVNAHYIFHIANKVNLYPLIGVGYAHHSSIAQGDPNFEEIHTPYASVTKEDYENSFKGSSNSFLFNFGVVGEYAITSKLSLGLEIKYQYIQHLSRLPISLGVTYNF